MKDLIERQAAIETANKIIERDTSGNNDVVKAMTAWKMYVEALPSAQPDLCDGCDRYGASCVGEGCGKLEMPEIIRCKDCKHNPKYEWFGCPMSHLNEKQRPETAWCWKGERRTDEPD